MTLRPCPFCGSEAERVKIGNQSTKKRQVIIRCTGRDCDAQQQTSGLVMTLAELDIFATLKWNKRTP